MEDSVGKNNPTTLHYSSDWDAAKSRVEKLLAEYGETIPGPEDTKEPEVVEPLDPEELKQILEQILPPTEDVPFDVEAAYNEALRRRHLG